MRACAGGDGRRKKEKPRVRGARARERLSGSAQAPGRAGGLADGPPCGQGGSLPGLDGQQLLCAAGSEKATEDRSSPRLRSRSCWSRPSPESPRGRERRRRPPGGHLGSGAGRGSPVGDAAECDGHPTPAQPVYETVQNSPPYLHVQSRGHHHVQLCCDEPVTDTDLTVIRRSTNQLVLFCLLGEPPPPSPGRRGGAAREAWWVGTLMSRGPERPCFSGCRPLEAQRPSPE